MASLPVREPYTDAELHRLYPAQLELQLVQVLMRHGERTPVTARFQNTGLHGFWPYCRSVRQLRSAILDPQAGEYTSLQWRRRLETFGHGDVPIVASGPRGELDDVCDMGALTDLGRQTTFDLGRRMRKLYVDQLGFLPDTISSSESLYLRSTPVPRALESMQQAFTGLYPATTRAPGFLPPTILSRCPQDETLVPNESNCRRFAALARAFAQRTAERWNDSPDMDYLNKKLGKWMPADSPRVAVDSHPRLSGIMDSMNASRAHGPETRLPAEFYDSKAVEIIERITVEEWYGGYGESNEYRTLGIGGLLGDVVARMVGSAEQTPRAAANDAHVPVKFGLSGCHDTTLAAVLSSLGAFGKDKWPPFTSYIAVEMFRAKDLPAPSTTPADVPEPRTSWSSWFSSFFSSANTGTPPPGIGRKPTPSLTPAEKEKLEGYYVRLRYNDSPVTIPGCRSPGNHLEGDESFCTLVCTYYDPPEHPFTPNFIAGCLQIRR